jgi:hypothetical protein
MFDVSGFHFFTRRQTSFLYFDANHLDDFMKSAIQRLILIYYSFLSFTLFAQDEDAIRQLFDKELREGKSYPYGGRLGKART